MEVFWMPDKEPQRPSGRGEGGQGAREGLGGRKVSAPSSSSSPKATGWGSGAGGTCPGSVMGRAVLVPIHRVLGTQGGAEPDKSWPSPCAGEEQHGATAPRVRKAEVNRQRWVAAPSRACPHLHKARDGDGSRVWGSGCLPVLGTGPGPSDSLFTGR